MLKNAFSQSYATPFFATSPKNKKVLGRKSFIDLLTKDFNVPGKIELLQNKKIPFKTTSALKRTSMSLKQVKVYGVNNTMSRKFFN